MDKLKQLCPCLPFPLFLPFSVLLVMGLQMSPSSKSVGKNSLCLTDPLATILFLFLYFFVLNWECCVRILCTHGSFHLGCHLSPLVHWIPEAQGCVLSSDISLQACHIHPITHHLVFLSYQPSVVALVVSKLLQLLIYILLSSVKTPPQWQGLGQSGVNFGSSAWRAALACAQPCVGWICVVPLLPHSPLPP